MPSLAMAEALTWKAIARIAAATFLPLLPSRGELCVRLHGRDVPGTTSSAES